MVKLRFQLWFSKQDAFLAALFYQIWIPDRFLANFEDEEDTVSRGNNDLIGNRHENKRTE